jgi:hypothetical protein
MTLRWVGQSSQWVDSRTRPFIDNSQQFWFFLTFENGTTTGPFYASYAVAHSLQNLSHSTQFRETLWIWT